MICERCREDVTNGRLVVRRTFAGFACNPCADEVKRIEWEERGMAKKNGNRQSKRKVAGAKSAGGNGSLAAVIDPMLFAGDKTVKEIAAELAKKGGEAAKGRDLAANVRARMVSYTRKGWQIEKDVQKRVKVVQQKG